MDDSIQNESTSITPATTPSSQREPPRRYPSTIRPFTPAATRPAPSGDPPDLTLWGDESGRSSRRS